jgi:hypothetical protein
MECGRQDSNLHGRLGAGKLAKVECPVAPKATAYANFATPAMRGGQQAGILLSDSSGLFLLLHPLHCLVNKLQCKRDVMRPFATGYDFTRRAV